MKCLAFDCAAGACSVAVLVDTEIVAGRAEEMERGHTEALVPMIQAVVREAGLDFAALDLIGVTVGPGAFTGIRIGLATARGLALAAEIPVAGVTTLAALAASVSPDRRAGRRVLAAVDTKRGDLYVQYFRLDGAAEGAPSVARPEDLAAAGPLLIVGDAPDDSIAPLLAAGAERATPRTVDPAALARRAVEDWRAGNALPAEPLYLRPPEARLPSRRGLRP